MTPTGDTVAATGGSGFVAGRCIVRLVGAGCRVRDAAPGGPRSAPGVAQLGLRRNPTAENARQLLGWSPRSSEQAIMGAAGSLVRLGLLGERGGLRAASRAAAARPFIRDEK